MEAEIIHLSVHAIKRPSCKPHERTVKAIESYILREGAIRNPILIDKNHHLIDGDARLQATINCGKGTIPCIIGKPLGLPDNTPRPRNRRT